MQNIELTSIARVSYTAQKDCAKENIATEARNSEYCCLDWAEVGKENEKNIHRNVYNGFSAEFQTKRRETERRDPTKF